MPVLPGAERDAIEAAARRLADGGLVAFPTETVYGLGARADDDAAVRAIFAAKGRPAEHPLIVHVTDAQAAQKFAAQWPLVAGRLAHAFWPGPLTVIVPRTRALAAAAAGGQASIGLRCPAHPVAQALLACTAKLGVAGVAAPSANRFGRVSPTRAQHVADEFGPDLWVLDGGDCDVGIESSVVDCTRGHPVLLSPGLLTREQLALAAGEPLRERDTAAPRASGTLASHYAPAATLRLMDAAQLKQALSVLPEPVQGVAVYSRTVPLRRAGPLRRTMPDDPAAAAHELFAALREFDAAGARLIWVEAPPDDPAWEGVADRLRRAAA